VFPSSRCPIQEIRFEGQMETMKIRGAARLMNSVYGIHMYIATEVQTCGFNCGLFYDYMF